MTILTPAGPRYWMKARQKQRPEIQPLPTMLNHSEIETAGTSGNEETPKPEPSYDEIALRAYFIALHRHSHGTPGDALQDWTEAERQLRVEWAG